MTELTRHSAMPEFLSPRRDGLGDGSWNVEEGHPVRGDAWTRLDERRMRVPVGSDETTRVVRAHEMMHARISPLTLKEAHEAMSEYHPRIVECAEEFRVNTLVGRAGFDLSALVDGSESKSGKRLAENDQWSEAVCYLTALAGTKGAADFLRGVRGANPDWAKALREVEKTLLKVVKRVPSVRIGSTTPSETHPTVPAGFDVWTRRFAEIIDHAIKAGEKTVTDEDGGDIEDVTEQVTPERIKNAMKSVGGEAGAFAPLRLDTDVPLTRHVAGTMGRKRIATNVGRNPRRIHRTLTDPERRIFDRVTKGQGGIIVIDQSGSMSLTTDDVWEIVNAAPGCVIIGYSHNPGTTLPNTWILADRGKVCETVREGRRGNGVDGPALRFALSKRKHGEAVIWVCDGMVTDGKSDHYYENLGEECASLVVRHGIHMVDNVSLVKEALMRVKRGERLPTTATGYLKHTMTWLTYNTESRVA